MMDNNENNEEVVNSKEIVIEEDSDVWDTLDKWSSNSSASITIDGVKINAVFGRIKSQLDFLKDKIKLLISAYNNRKPDEEINLLIENVKNLEFLCEKARLEGERLDGEVRQNRQAIKLHEEKQNEFMNYVESKFTYYRTNINSLTEQLNAMKDKDIRTQKRFNDIELQQSQNFIDLKNSVDKYKEENNQTMKQMTLTIDRLKEEVVSAKNTVEKMEGQVIHVGDIVAVNDLRVDELSKKFLKSNAFVDDLKAEFDNFPRIHIDPLTKTVTEVVLTKADRTELLTKADASLAFMKADAEEINRLDNILTELERRVTGHRREVGEELVSFDNKIERKGDRITQNCLKEMRRLLGKIVLPKESSTDIGKVKCLVCDQATMQSTEAQGTIFGGPPLKGVIKELRHDSPGNNNQLEDDKGGRSKSPITPSNKAQINDFTDEVDEFSNTRISSRARLNAFAAVTIPLPQQQTLPKMSTNHSKLVRMGANPIGTQHCSPVSGELFNRNVTIPSDDSTDFRPQIVPVSQSEGGNPTLDNNPLLPTQKLQYFKDLEE